MKMIHQLIQLFCRHKLITSYFDGHREIVTCQKCWKTWNWKKWSMKDGRRQATNNG